MKKIILICLFSLFAVGLASANNPVDPNYKWEGYKGLYPPGGFDPKNDKIVANIAAVGKDPKIGKGSKKPLVDETGKFYEWGQFFYKMTTEPAEFRRWWVGYWEDTNIWHYSESPVFKGYQPNNQGHRQFAGVGAFITAVQRHPDIDPEIKAKVGSEAWKRGVEKIVREETLDELGLISHKLSNGRVHQGNMAQTFHFMRTKYGAMKLDVPNIYTLENAQNLTTSVLTLPWIICEEDKWVEPPNDEYLEKIGVQKGGLNADITWVKDGKILFAGGNWIGWASKPALHGTWDGLAILNALFKYYPDPDPNSPKSIYYKWNKLPEEKKQIGKKAIKLCADRLWLDWKERGKPIWCWVKDGKPTNEDLKPSEAPWMPCYDGYGDNQVGWAHQCWNEIFGDPSRGTPDGARALLEIANGRVLKKLTMPVGQQVPGRVNFDAGEQRACIDEDIKKLDDPKHTAMIKKMYGLSVEEAKKRISEYAAGVNLPPGVSPDVPVSDEPKLDPKKAGKAKTGE